MRTNLIEHGLASVSGCSDTCDIRYSQSVNDKMTTYTLHHNNSTVSFEYETGDIDAAVDAMDKAWKTIAYHGEVNDDLT